MASYVKIKKDNGGESHGINARIAEEWAKRTGAQLIAPKMVEVAPVIVQSAPAEKKKAVEVAEKSASDPIRDVSDTTLKEITPLIAESRDKEWLTSLLKDDRKTVRKLANKRLQDV